MTDISTLKIETERLMLRPPTADDLKDWAAFQSDEVTMTHLGGVKSRSASWRDLCCYVGAWHVRGFAMFSVLLKDNGKWIGRVGPWQPEDWPGTEVGWGLAREFEGNGYALEAVIASIDYVFDVLDWEDVMHTINPHNLPSIKLAERLGSVNRGRTFMPQPYNEIEVYNWGQTREQWRQNRKQFQ